LRRITLDDVPSVRALLERIGWAEAYVAGMERAALDLAAWPDGAAFAAVEEGSLVGFCLVARHAWNNLAQIQGLAMEPARQRLGIATALVGAAEEWAQASGARGIYVDTPVDNLPGRAFYLSIGYAEAYVMPHYYAADLDGVTFQKFF
jgi:GNAT superfamily N-acetyltransferase